jgi:hypothetical protein
MQSNTMRAVLGIGVVVLAVVLLIVLKDSDDSGSGQQGSVEGAALAVPTIVVKNGAPEGGVRSLTYIKGDQIRFQVDSDTGDEVHIHGYDLSEDVEAGGSVRFDFPADLEGVFEVELEGRKAQIAELRVSP